MAKVNAPPINAPFNRDDGSVEPAWADWCTQIYRSAQMDYGSGTTAQRPTKDLRAGGRYFDTSLAANGRPIWINKGATGWVHDDGTAA